MPVHNDALENADLSKLPPLKQPDWSEIQGPLVAAGLSQVYTEDGVVPPSEQDHIDTEIGFPEPVAQQYGDLSEDQRQPAPQGQGQAEIVRFPRPRNLLPGTTIHRNPDGLMIVGITLQPGVVGQIIQGRAGLVLGQVWNIGNTLVGSNPVYLTHTRDEAENIAENIDGYAGMFNAINLPIMDPAGYGLSKPYEHKTEAALYGVSPLGSFVAVSITFHKALSTGSPSHHKHHGELNQRKDTNDRSSKTVDDSN